ncbi:MAG: cytochrome c-type biosis protein CcdA, partial [Thermoleophilia bacterium]|nr:cytochrome c-type biosis protein CcdA [Thermoleophilia bacterium]
PARLASAAQRSTAHHAAPRSALAAMPVGAAFAIAWSPCIGPALAAILALAAGDARPAWGAALLVVYGLGLGIPFLLGAVAIDRIGGISRALRRHGPRVRVIGGALLLLLGVAIATGRFGEVTSRLARIAPDWLV